MNILLFGCRGQVGWELQRSLTPIGTVTALHRRSEVLCGDLEQPDQLAQTIRAVKPQVIVNAAGYTAVDRAEIERETAFSVNATACGVLAKEALALGALLVHYSTDYVFDGTGTRPWRETDPTLPVNSYGASKLAGEKAIRDIGPPHLIFRTCWVFETWGHNFIKVILKSAREREKLSVIADQWSTPTRAALIADITALILTKIFLTKLDVQRISGIYHLAAAGETSWHSYASLVVQEALSAGMPLRIQPEAIEAIPTSAYPLPAARPLNSRLDTSLLRKVFNLTFPPWQDGVRAVVTELVDQQLGEM